MLYVKKAPSEEGAFLMLEAHATLREAPAIFWILPSVHYVS